MGRPKKIVEAVEVPRETENSSQSRFEVFDAKGNFVREYTVEASGKYAGELAKAFAEEINGSVK